MAIQLAPAANARFITSIKRFFTEQLDEDIGG